MGVELIFSLVFFALVSAACIWGLRRARGWAVFWRRKQAVTLKVVDAQKIQHKVIFEEGAVERYKTDCLTYEALDGPLEGKFHQSSVTTNPPILEIGDEVQGFCDPDTGRMESKKALWFIYGTIAVLSLILGWIWLQSLRWLLFEIFMRGAV